MSRIEQPFVVRTYTDEEVEEYKIDKILDLVMEIPSSSNQHPWELIIVRDKKTLKTLSISTPYAWMVRDAGCAIVVLGNLDKVVFKETWDQDCSAVTEGIMLRAIEQELGAFWLGLYPYEERMNYISDVFDLPSRIVPFAVIPIGYLTQKNSSQKHFTNGKVHYERWTKK